eukprot:7798870-Prorocentrum_lima.AAC.1
MTSSLVGSEMCIRDRTRGGRQRPSRRFFYARMGWFQSTAIPAYKTAADAVSYTHLTLPTICSV